MKHKILKIDPYLAPFAADFDLRVTRYREKIAQLGDLREFAGGHYYFGFHRNPNGWYYREWAPGADRVYLTGDFNGWDRRACPLTRLDNGVWEVFLPGFDALQEGQTVLTLIIKDNRELERIPLYARYVVQDPVNHSWNAKIHLPNNWLWTDGDFKPQNRIYN